MTKSKNLLLLSLASILFSQQVFAEWYIDPNQCRTSLSSYSHSPEGFFNTSVEREEEIWCSSPTINDYGTTLQVQIQYLDNHPHDSIYCDAISKDGSGMVVERTQMQTSGNGGGILFLEAPERTGAVLLPKSVVVHCFIPNQGDWSRLYDASGIKSIRVY